jgi:hypothetical protein
MKILVFGDIMGRPGREALKLALPELKAEFEPDLTIANVENLSHGKGVTVASLREMLVAGVDLFTSGNHVWDKKEVMTVLADRDLGDRLLRPANYPPSVPGRGAKSLTIGTKTVLVVNLMGRVFGKVLVDDPFRSFDDILRDHAASHPSVVLVDFHAEATSEKVAFGWHAAGRATAVWGTHSHVPTADARILPGADGQPSGTAYVTDVGMVGYRDGVLGLTKEPILANFRTQLPATHELPASGEAIVTATVIEVDAKGKATDIKTVQKTYPF